MGKSSGMQISLFIAVFIFGLFVLESMRRKVRVLHFHVSDWALIGFALMIFMSTFVQFNVLTQEECLLFIKNYGGGILPTLLIYFVVRIGMKNKKRIELMMKWLLISTAVSCTYGILDFIIVAVFERSNLSWLYNNPAFTGLSMASVIDFFLPRARGFMGEPNIFAGLLLTVFPLALYRSSLILIGLILIALVLTMSPVAVLILPVFFWIYASRIGRTLVPKCSNLAKLFLIIITIAVILFLALVNADFSNFIQESRISKLASSLPGNNGEIEDGSAIVRMDTFLIGWQLFLEKPILGHGYGILSLKIPLYQSEASLFFSGGLGQGGVHSALISILATNGLVGVSAAVIWFICVVASIRKLMRCSPEHRVFAWVWLSSFVIMVVYLCSSSMQWPALYFVSVIAAITTSLPGALMPGPYSVRRKLKSGDIYCIDVAAYSNKS